MSERLTDEQIAELKRLDREATAPPWRWVQKDGDYHVLTNSADDSQPYPQIHSDGSAGGEYSPDIDVRSADGQIIPAARNALPGLLSELRLLRALASAVDARERHDTAETCAAVGGALREWRDVGNIT
jgi:hypothetical protein